MTDPTHALGSIDEIAAAFQDGFTNGNATWDETPEFHKEMFREGARCAMAVMSSPDYLERVRAMEEENARLKSDRLYTIGFNDGYDTALSNREDGDV